MIKFRRTVILMILPALTSLVAAVGSEDSPITLTSGLEDYQVFQRNEVNRADIPFSGSCAFDEQGTVEGRVVDPLTSVSVIDWQKAGEFADRKWRGVLYHVPVGGPYRIEIRLKDSQEKIRASVSADNILIGDLWILAGQSNMQGVGELQDAEPPSLYVHSYGFNEKWTVAAEPLHWLLDSIDPIHQMGLTGERLERERTSQKKEAEAGTGCGLPFAKELAEKTGVPVGLVPCAHGGTLMKQWDPAKKEEGGNSLYGSMYRRFLAVGGKVKGMLWYQGESDANEIDAPLFHDRFTQFVAAVRRDFNAPQLPFYFAQISRIITKGTFPYWNFIREQQRLCAAEIPHCRMVASLDLTLDDPVHVSTDGHKRLGRRFARLALRELFGRTEWTCGPELDYLLPMPSRFKHYRMHFSNVNKTLRTADRPCGFSLRDPKENDLGLLYKTGISPDGHSIDLFLFDQPPPGSFLWYGYGLDPYCNVTDGEDMALAAFGPFPFDDLVYQAFLKLMRDEPDHPHLPTLIPYVMAFAEKNPNQENEIYSVVKRLIRTLPPENRMIFYPLLFKKGDFSYWDEWLADARSAATAKRKQIAQSFQGGDDAPPLKAKLIKNWHAVGMFDNSQCKGFDQASAPEFNSALDQKYVNTKGDTLRWVSVQADADGRLNLKQLLGASEYVLGYLQATVEAKKTVEIPVLWGSDDGAVIWINGQEVHREHVHRPLTCSSDLLIARFHKGESKILVKVCQRIGDWGFCLRLLDKEGLLAVP